MGVVELEYGVGEGNRNRFLGFGFLFFRRKEIRLSGSRFGGCESGSAVRLGLFW